MQRLREVGVGRPHQVLRRIAPSPFKGELELSVLADVVRHTHTDKQTKRDTKFEVGTTHPTVCVQASILIWTPTFASYQA